MAQGQEAIYTIVISSHWSREALHNQTKKEISRARILCWKTRRTGKTRLEAIPSRHCGTIARLKSFAQSFQNEIEVFHLRSGSIYRLYDQSTTSQAYLFVSP